jgi:hypothetical protein
MKDYAKEELERMSVLVGKTVSKVAYDSENEGCYTLTFTDGTTVDFSSSGDDATFTSMGIEEGQ